MPQPKQAETGSGGGGEVRRGEGGREGEERNRRREGGERGRENSPFHRLFVLFRA